LKKRDLSAELAAAEKAAARAAAILEKDAVEKARAQQKSARRKVSAKNATTMERMTRGEIYERTGMTALMKNGLQDAAFMAELDRVGRAIHVVLHKRPPEPAPANISSEFKEAAE
jgi:rubrerythrin